MLTIDPKLEPRAAARALTKRLTRAAKRGDGGGMSSADLASGMERVTYLVLALCMIDELRLAGRLVVALRGWLRESDLETRANVDRRGPRLRMIQELIGCEPLLSRTFRDALVDAIGSGRWAKVRHEVDAETPEARDALIRDAPTIVEAIDTSTPKRGQVLVRALRRALKRGKGQGD